MDSPVDGCWFSVLSCPCANHLGPSWLAQFDFLFTPSQPLDFPKKKCWDFFWTHLTASTPHPPTHPPTPLAYSFSHLPSHLHISNDLISYSPTYLPTHLPTKWHSHTYLPTHLPLCTYQRPTHHTSMEKCQQNQMRVLQFTWRHQMTRSNEGIAFHRVNDCTILSLSYLLALKVNTYQTPPICTYLLSHQYNWPPSGHCDVRIKKYASIAFPLDLFTQATYNAHMKMWDN